MASRTITVSARITGDRETVRVIVYDTRDEMIAAAQRYNGTTLEPDCIGVTQARVDEHGRTVGVIVRLWREQLGTRVVSHEMHHAVTALYGANVPDRLSRRAHLNHYNEPFAYLYSDLLARLVDRLHALGYYDDGGVTCATPPSATSTAPSSARANHPAGSADNPSTTRSRI